MRGQRSSNLEQLNSYRPVRASCWLREDEDVERYLHVALEGRTTENSGLAYSEVLRIARALKGHYIDPYRVKLIGTDHPVAKALLELYRRYPGRIPSRLDGRIFAGTAVAELYVYPQPAGKP